MSLTAKVRNINPMGDVVLTDPETGERHQVAAGEILEVSPELAEHLITQEGNWAPVPKSGIKVHEHDDEKGDDK